MATRTAKLRVEIDGEKEYKQAISELNKGNQVLASEMRKLSAEYKGNEDSVEALTAKGDLLERQLLQQRDKVQTLRDALANAAEQYGEADRRTQEWQIKLNDAETAQINLERAIDENNKSIDEQKEGFVEETRAVGSLGDQVSDLAGKLGIRIPEEAKKALNGIKGMSVESVAALGAIAGAAAAAVQAVKALHELTIAQAANADSLVTQGMVSGVDTRTLQQWQYASELIDVSADTITGSMSRITRTMYDAMTGNESAQQSFEALGISITDSEGQLRSAEDVFYEVIDALGGVQNQTERDAIAMDLMGKSAQELNPLILQGSDALRELAAEAEATGYVLDESQIAKLAEVDDAYQRTQLQIEATKNKLAVEFAPASKAAMETFGNVVQKAGQILVDTRLIENLGAIVQGVMAIIDAGANFAGAIPNWLNPIENLSIQLRVLASVAAVVADGMNALSGWLPWNWGSGKLSTALGLGYGSGNANNYQRLQMSYAGTLEDYDAFYGRNASGNDNWRGGLTYINEAGPEAVFLPNGSQILSAQDTRLLGSGGNTYNINVANVEELQQLLDLLDGLRVRRRMG
ncbi:MAG: hypothetical protein IJI06_02355 [Oscillospiraceae bacterium]|nr:hypothetical protein [Oscillospiraceae bacterium]